MDLEPLTLRSSMLHSKFRLLLIPDGILTVSDLLNAIVART